MLTAATLAATASAAQAAACKLESGVLEVRMIDPGFARFAVVADAIVVVGRNAVTCSGGPPTTTNTNTVLLVDDSDDPSTSTPHDGNSTVEISDPQTFAAGATAEPTGTPEIEFLLDMRARPKAVRMRVRCSPACAITARAGTAKRVRTALEPGVAKTLELARRRRHARGPHVPRASRPEVTQPATR